jgi:hypothetical protein
MPTIPRMVHTYDAGRAIRMYVGFVQGVTYTVLHIS